MRTKWIECTKDVYFAIYYWMRKINDISVYSTITDPNGYYGNPLIFTEWGLKSGNYALIKCERNPKPESSCVEYSRDTSDQHWKDTYYIARQVICEDSHE